MGNPEDEMHTPSYPPSEQSRRRRAGTEIEIDFKATLELSKGHAAYLGRGVARFGEGTPVVFESRENSVLTAQ